MMHMLFSSLLLLTVCQLSSNETRLELYVVGCCVMIGHTLFAVLQKKFLDDKYHSRVKVLEAREQLVKRHLEFVRQYSEYMPGKSEFENLASIVGGLNKEDVHHLAMLGVEMRRRYMNELKEKSN